MFQESSFSFLKLVKSTKVKYLVDFLCNILITYSSPQVILSDQGLSFTSIQFCHFYCQNYIEYINCNWTPRTSGQVERLNRSILNFIMTCCSEED